MFTFTDRGNNNIAMHTWAFRGIDHHLTVEGDPDWLCDHNGNLRAHIGLSEVLFTVHVPWCVSSTFASC